MATSSTNMSLTLWNSLADPYDSSELVDNFVKIDSHDHTGTSNKGLKIKNAALASTLVGTSTFASGSTSITFTVTGTNYTLPETGASISGTGITSGTTITSVTGTSSPYTIGLSAGAASTQSSPVTLTITGKESVDTSVIRNASITSAKLDTAISITNLTVTGSIAHPYNLRQATSGAGASQTYTVSSSSDTIIELVQNSSDAFSALTLPTSVAGQIFTIRNSQTVAAGVVVSVPSGKTFNGVTNGTFTLLPGQQMQFTCSGSNGNYITSNPLPPTYVTSLPSSPYHGQLVYYAADATNGINWHLRYNANSASSYKWEYLGGGSLYNAVAADESTTSATYTALTTSGPTPTTLALAGDYMIAFGSTAYTAGTNVFSYHSFDVGGTGAIDADALEYRNSAANVPRTAQSRTVLKTGISAGSSIVSKYKSGTSGTAANFKNRWMQITPVRVG